MKLGDEIVELKDWDGVRVPPGTWRGYEAGPEGLEIPVIHEGCPGQALPNAAEGPRWLRLPSEACLAGDDRLPLRATSS
jgi:hypothetical protein